MVLRLVERTESLLFQQADESQDVLLLFSGRNAGFRSPLSFHFFGSTGHLPINKLYLRDCFGLWYHGGLAGHTSSISETAAFLSDFLAQYQFGRVRMVGVSSGGYAALLFGALLGADSIYSLSPRTFLDPVNRRRHGDARLEEGFDQLYRTARAEPTFFDLDVVLREHRPRAWPCDVHYDPGEAIDRAHAEHLSNTPGVRLVTHPGAGHAVGVALMREPTFVNRVMSGR